MPVLKVQAAEARETWSALLEGVRHGDHVEVDRYTTPSGFLVPPAFYHAARQALGMPPADTEP